MRTFILFSYLSWVCPGIGQFWQFVVSSRPWVLSIFLSWLPLAGTPLKVVRRHPGARWWLTLPCLCSKGGGMKTLLPDLEYSFFLSVLLGQMPCPNCSINHLGQIFVDILVSAMQECLGHSLFIYSPLETPFVIVLYDFFVHLLYSIVSGSGWVCDLFIKPGLQ